MLYHCLLVQIQLFEGRLDCSVLVGLDGFHLEAERIGQTFHIGNYAEHTD